jgi:large subunit ribosomal protein L27
LSTKASQGSVKNNRDSESNRLGIKCYGGEFVDPGNIIVRQRGTKYHPGLNVGRGKDDTLFAEEEGYVVFNRKGAERKYVSVLSESDLELLRSDRNGSNGHSS